MDVTAFLADSVVVADGKLFVQGAGWTTISASSFPVHHDRIGIGVLIHVPYSATNQMHALEVEMQDFDNQPVSIGDAPPEVSPDGRLYKLGGQFNVGRPPLLPVGDEQIVPIALNVNGMRFEVPGMYSVVISIDGTEMRRLPFRVQPIQPTPGPLPGQP